MEFLGKLGIDWRMLIAQIVNFTLLLIILNKYVYKPILKKIKKEETEIEKLKKDKEDIEKEREKISLIQTNEVVKAKKEARSILKEAEELAEEIKNKAQKEILIEKESVMKQLKNRLDK